MQARRVSHTDKCSVHHYPTSPTRRIRLNSLKHMKMKLPKILALAVLSSAAANAEYVPAKGLLVPDATISEGSITPDSTAHASYYALMKDGSGTVTITENVSLKQALYVREGEVLVGNQDKQVTLNLSPSDNPNDEWDNPSRPYLPNLVVAGKNTGDKYATITFNNAALTSGQEATVIIGSADGNGAMVVDNNSKIGLGNSQTTMIGERIGLSSGCPTADAEGNKYVGSYSEAANGSGTLFGRGVVTVQGASTLNTGYQQFYMSEGELNADGAGTQVNIGGTYGTWTEFGYDADSTSEVNVTNGAKVNVRTQYIITGDSLSDNSTVNINVDGAGSSFTVDEYTPAHPEVPNSAQATMTVLGYYSGTATGAAEQIKSNTTINVTNGGTANLNSKQTMLGYGDMADGSSVTLNVDETSTLNSKDVFMYKGSEINNEGTTTLGKLYLNGAGSVENNGILSVNELWIKAGEVINSDTIEGTVVLSAGTFTALENSRLQSMHLMGGSFVVEGDITMDGFLAGYGVGELIIKAGGSIDMNGNMFKLDGSKLILEVGYDVTDDTEFYLGDIILNAGETDLTTDTAVEIRGTNGTSTTRPVSSIPEPTTATLSLLALAALAARRRRK